jgi:hypothetical protein
VSWLPESRDRGDVLYDSDRRLLRQRPLIAGTHDADGGPCSVAGVNGCGSARASVSRRTGCERGIRVARTVPVSNRGNLERKQRAAPVMLTRQRHPDELWSERFKEVGRSPGEPTTLLEDLTQPAVEILVNLRPSTLVLCT